MYGSTISFDGFEAFFLKIPVKYSHTYAKEIKILNYLLTSFKLPQIYGSTITFAYFETFFLKILTVKNFFPGGLLSPPEGGVLPPYVQKLYMILLPLL